MEVYVVKYTDSSQKEIDKRGYLDLYDVATNTFYEVKSRGAYAATNGAKDQLERYSLSVVESRKVVLKPIDSPTPGSKLVSGTFEYGLYDVSYWSEVPGVIIYKPTLNDERAKAYTSVIVTVVFVVAAYVLGTCLFAVKRGAYERLDFYGDTDERNSRLSLSKASIILLRIGPISCQCFKHSLL